jgi:hypothetical protein
MDGINAEKNAAIALAQLRRETRPLDDNAKDVALAVSNSLRGNMSYKPLEGISKQVLIDNIQNEVNDTSFDTEEIKNKVFSMLYDGRS